MDYRTTIATLNGNIKHFEGRIKTLEIRKAKFQNSLNKTMELKDFIRLATLSIVRKEHEVEIKDIQNDINEFLLDIKSIQDDINGYKIEGLFSDDILATLPNEEYVLKGGYKLILGGLRGDELLLRTHNTPNKSLYTELQSKVTAYNDFNEIELDLN